MLHLEEIPEDRVTTITWCSEGSTDQGKAVEISIWMELFLYFLEGTLEPLLFSGLGMKLWMTSGVQGWISKIYFNHNFSLPVRYCSATNFSCTRARIRTLLGAPRLNFCPTNPWKVDFGRQAWDKRPHWFFSVIELKKSSEHLQLDLLPKVLNWEKGLSIFRGFFPSSYV
jgi:hypothetical protein